MLGAKFVQLMGPEESKSIGPHRAYMLDLIVDGHKQQKVLKMG